MMRQLAPTTLPLLAAISIAACAQPTLPTPPGESVQGVAVYALSRGKGVPEQARQVLARALERFNDELKREAVVAITDQRIGLEGERRVCATFADETRAVATFQQLLDLARGVELVNIVREPCRKADQKSGSLP